ncbi:MAG: hypothetical protein CMJ95_00465 [Planctomycetes bacterium]|nr:hypothetical protein [Planctomycetota bacterium]
MRWQRLTILTLSLLWGGCAHTIGVHVDGESARSMQAGETYSFVVGGPQAVEGSERWQVTTATLTRILQQQGLQQASAKETADWRLFVDYGVGEPQVRERYYVSPMAYGRFASSGRNRLGLGFSARFRTRTETRIPLYLRVEGVYGDTTDETRSWRSSAVRISTRGDLDQILPALAWALRDIIGHSTTGNRSLSVPINPDQFE